MSSNKSGFFRQHMHISFLNFRNFHTLNSNTKSQIFQKFLHCTFKYEKLDLIKEHKKGRGIQIDTYP